MKSTCKWLGNYKSVVDNGANHSIQLDLPEEKGGENSGPTALEMLLMSLNGCVSTIFALVATKMRLSYSELTIEMFSENENNSPSITYVEFEFSIKTEEPKEKIEKCLETTLKTCPVGLLFEKAGVEIQYNINYL